MLQAVNEKSRTNQASSIYCVWTTRDGNPGTPLVAVWIDSAMRVFEGECALGVTEEAVELNSDEPGGFVLVGVSLRTFVAIESETLSA